MSSADSPSKFAPVAGCGQSEPEIRHAVELLRRINEQRLDQDPTCDFTISAGNESFKVHRAVLVASSDYFRAMLHGPMIESTCSQVDLKAVSPESLSLLVTFLYTGRLSLSWKTVADVVHAASHLQIDEALERCCAYLLGCVDTMATAAAAMAPAAAATGNGVPEFSADSSDGDVSCPSAGGSDSLARLCDLVHLAETYSLTDVTERACVQLARDFGQLMRAAEFVDLSAATLSRLLEFDGLAVGSELELFRLVERWHRAQVPPCSAQDAALVFGRLRYATMSPAELQAVSESRPATGAATVAAVPVLRQLVDEALDYHRQLGAGLPAPRLSGSPSRLRCRNAEDCLVVAVHGSSSKPFQIMACRLGGSVVVVTSAAGAALVTNPPRAVGESAGIHEHDFFCLYSDNASDSRTCGLAAIDGFLYVLSLVDVGGFDHDRFLSVLRIDPRGLHATCELRRPPSSRQVGAVVACGHHLYVLGGASLDGSVHTADCDRYDVTQNAWEKLSPLPCAAHFTAAVEYRGAIYVCGGQARPSGPLSRACWSFRPGGEGSVTDGTEDAWLTMPDMISPRRSHAMVTVYDKLYVLGGLCDTPASSSLVPVEQFDFVQLQWTQLSRPMTVRGTSIGRYVSFNDSIYVLGHELYTAVENEIWYLLPAQDSDGQLLLLEDRLAVMPHGISLGCSFAAAMKLSFSDPLICEKKVALSPYRAAV